jgi:hypothetical protein
MSVGTDKDNNCFYSLEVSFKITSPAERPNIVKVDMAMKNVPDLKR